MVKRKRFNQTSILKKLNAKCERCGIAARSKEAYLTIHHKNHRSDDTDWKNIVIYCRKCHSIIEGTDKRKSERR
ncbi:HNH endonuclease [Nitrosarchaeum koreense]|nr:HNH endonuclease [Nitrosarchaeum koreense]